MTLESGDSLAFLAGNHQQKGRDTMGLIADLKEALKELALSSFHWDALEKVAKNSKPIIDSKDQAFDDAVKQLGKLNDNAAKIYAAASKEQNKQGRDKKLMQQLSDKQKSINLLKPEPKTIQKSIDKAIDWLGEMGKIVKPA